MNRFRLPIAVLALSLLVSVCMAVPGYAAGEWHGVKLDLGRMNSGFTIVVPEFKEVKEVSFTGMDGSRQVEPTLVMGAPEPDGEGHYPIMQFTTVSDAVYSFDARFGTYQDGVLSQYEGIFADGRSAFNPGLAIDGSMAEFAKDKVFNLKINFYDKDKNVVYAVENVNVMFVDKKELPAQALPSSAKVIVDGREIAFEAYNIRDNNYFKLRDLAKVLDVSPKRFGVGWDDANNAISLAKNAVYKADGTELAMSGKQTEQTALPSTAKIYLDGSKAEIAAYNIADYNYFKLRDLAKLIDFNVTWDDEHNTVGIDTKNGYVEPKE